MAILMNSFPPDVLDEALESIGVDLEFVHPDVEVPGGLRGQRGFSVEPVTDDQARQLAFVLAFNLAHRHIDMDKYREDLAMVNDLMGSIRIGYGSRGVRLYFPGWQLA